MYSYYLIRARRVLINCTLGAAGALFVVVLKINAVPAPSTLLLLIVGVWGAVFHYASRVYAGYKPWCYILLVVSAIGGAVCGIILLTICAIIASVPLGSVDEISKILATMGGWSLGIMLWLRANGISISWLTHFEHEDV